MERKSYYQTKGYYAQISKIFKGGFIKIFKGGFIKYFSSLKLGKIKVLRLRIKLKIKNK